MSDLIERLREAHKWGTIGTSMFGEAADRIEELETENAKLREGVPMSDLIKRLRMGTQVPEFELRQEAADEIERLERLYGGVKNDMRDAGKVIASQQAEIERLRNQLSFMTKECKRFEAVVDAAKRSREVDEYGLLSVEKGWDLDKALAALEENE